ncbi:MAG: hypothetical protein KGR26_10090 [Cyanobacteria bacterium REEB65]|nr:hypothetical protein [Cyanobacteria bacterium REEB65]
MARRILLVCAATAGLLSLLCPAAKSAPAVTANTILGLYNALQAGTQAATPSPDTAPLGRANPFAPVKPPIGNALDTILPKEAVNPAVPPAVLATPRSRSRSSARAASGPNSVALLGVVFNKSGAVAALRIGNQVKLLCAGQGYGPVVVVKVQRQSVMIRYDNKPYKKTLEGTQEAK